MEENKDSVLTEEEQASEYKKNDEEEKEEDTPQEESKEDKDEEKSLENDDDDEKEKSKKYSLDEIPEYVELKSSYAALQQQYNDLNSAHEAMTAEIEGLRKFKLDTERVQKQDMIANFFMLSDEDKADVVANIDTYSLDDIEAKLSVACYRNKVSFAESASESDASPAITYNLNAQEEQDTAPEWIKLVRRYQNREESK